TIRKDRIPRLILPSLTRKSACIAAALFFATTSIAHAISLARAEKVRSTPAQITSVFDAFDHRRISRNVQERISFSNMRGNLFYPLGQSLPPRTSDSRSSVQTIRLSTASPMKYTV